MNFRESEITVRFREGEAPAEPPTDAETHGSAGASPSRSHNRTRLHPNPDAAPGSTLLLN